MRAPRGSGSLTVRVQGVDGIRRALAPLLEPELTNILDKSTKAAAKTFQKAVKAEAAPVSKRMARSVRVHRAKTGKPGWVVGSRRKIAFFWPFVIGGTRAHGPRRKPVLRWQKDGQTIVARHVRGVRPNPLVERAAKRTENKAFADAEHQFSRSAPL